MKIITSFFRRTGCLVLTALIFCSFFALPSQAKVYTMSRSSLPANTNVRSVRVTLNKRKGTMNFTIRAQTGYGLGRTSYIARHGCAVSALTTVLAAYNNKYASCSRMDVVKKLERKTFGVKAWKKNYSKSPGGRMPVSLYGISRVLKRYGVQNTYIRRFSDAGAVKTIENHLRKGNVVILEVNNRMQKNGHFGKASKKWARSKHTMALLGITDKGKVIVADSATRDWAGSNQRIKYTTMSSLVRYMIPCKSSAKHYYFHSVSDSGGFILVK